MSLRLLAVLFVSGALHAAAVFAPYLGASAEFVNPSQRRTAGLTGPSAFTVAITESTSETQVENRVLANSASPSEATIETVHKAEPRRVGSDLLPVKGIEYFTPKELTLPAKPLAEILLEPAALGSSVQAGSAILKLWIDPTGGVTDIDVVSSDAPKQFVDYAMQVFKRSRFAPGQKDGVPVGSIMKIEIRYEESPMLPKEKKRERGNN